MSEEKEKRSSWKVKLAVERNKGKTMGSLKTDGCG